MLFGPQVPVAPTRPGPASGDSLSSAVTATSVATLEDGTPVERKKKKKKRKDKDGSRKSLDDKAAPPRTRRDHDKKKSQSLTVAESPSSSQDITAMYPSVWKSLKYRRKATAGSLHKPVCVTGVDGFLAAWVVAELLLRGYKVRGTVQNKSDDISKLYDLPHAKKNLAIVETSLLTAQSCDLAVDGCDFVIHTGTPTSCSVRDPFSEQNEPGVYSISSRVHCIVPMMNNFITACIRAKVKRVVLTSSVAAMTDHVDITSAVDDSCWNASSSLERNPHFLSLKLAEEAAWQLVKNESMELVTINPGMLVGPSLCNAKIPPGTQVVYDLIAGQYSALVDFNYALTDVRDCAMAHVLVLEYADARGRYICVNRTVWMKEVVQILAQNGYSGRNLPYQVGLPSWVAMLPAYAIQLGQVGVSLYPDDPSRAAASPYSNARLLEVFRFHDILHFRDVKTTVLDSAADLLKWSLIKPWAEDHVANECSSCKAQFTLVRRRHHCRECGNLVCGNCSVSRAIVEGFEDAKQRFCDQCVRTSLPAALARLSAPADMAQQRKAAAALESLMENPNNHDLLARLGGIPALLLALHSGDDVVTLHAAQTLHRLSLRLSSALHLVLEGAVLHMLEMEEGSATWRACLGAMRNVWRYISREDFRTMLYAALRLTPATATGRFKGNVMLTLVHMLDPSAWPRLLPEGLLAVLLALLKAPDDYAHRTVAYAIKHLLPSTYLPDVAITFPVLREAYDRETELVDVQFVVEGRLIGANRVVLSVQNPYFKSLLSGPGDVVEIEDCSYATFLALINFLYTEDVALDLATAGELLVAAASYHVPELQKRCEKFLAEEITVANAMTVWALADQCQASDLKRAALPFLLKHVCSVVKTPGFAANHAWVADELVEELCVAMGPRWVREWRAFYSSAAADEPELVEPEGDLSPTAAKLDAPRASDLLSESSSMGDDLMEGIC
ncbi:dihydroflavonol-4-reductase [Achlya hypogyna]|uniref:Dihydroflavonol-4-reductase n=1 Tax=Achlya hypogyna TaxID=1202772 RepID=A0A1V9YGI0_ACHHY|nr:dihydroflavonol-4-reductase [Achlya hypogyna]